MNPGEKFSTTIPRGTDGHTRHRVHLGLDSAFKVLRRAEARGATAHIVLCELRAVGELS